MKRQVGFTLIVLVFLLNPISTQNGYSVWLGDNYTVKAGDSALYTQKLIYYNASLYSYNYNFRNYTTFELSNRSEIIIPIDGITYKVKVMQLNTSIVGYKQVFININVHIPSKGDFISPIYNESYTIGTGLGTYINYICPIFQNYASLESLLHQTFESDPLIKFNLTDTLYTIIFTSIINTRLFDIKAVLTYAYNWHTGWLEYRDEKIFGNNVLIRDFKISLIHPVTFLSPSIEFWIDSLIILSIVVIISTVWMYFYRKYKNFLKNNPKQISFWNYCKNWFTSHRKRSNINSIEIKNALNKIDKILEENQK